MDNSELPIRVQARAVVINAVGEILLIQHTDTVPADPNEPERLVYWVVPGGKLEQGESLRDCAERETVEETGVSGLSFVAELPIIRKPLMFAQGMRMMEAHYFLFRCDGKPAVWLNSPTENITDVCWWKLEEIEASRDAFLPASLFQDLNETIRRALPPSAAR
jgi:ADP-ribose pyrophosphatase YjhB (NUDIX family)